MCTLIGHRMAKIPDTRQTLLRRVKNADDGAAWAEFVAIYRPAVLRFAMRRGLQSADAEDVAQRVFVSVARAMVDWRADDAAGSFRAWLLQVTRNAVLNVLARPPKTPAAGGTSALRKLNQLVDARALDEELDWEYRRAEFRQAATKVQQEVEPNTWQAFWLTAVDKRKISETAAELGMSTGGVYAARSRVLRRIKQQVESQRQRQNGD